MGYKYWGSILKHDDGTWSERRGVDGPQTPIDPSQWSEELKTKIAMLDFMEVGTELPCGSYKRHYRGLKFLAYYIKLG